MDDSEKKKITEIGKESPPSQFKEDENPETAAEVVAKANKLNYTRAIIIQATEDYDQFRIIENFSYGDKEYKSVCGQVELMLLKVSGDVQSSKVASLVMEKIMNDTIEITSPGGQKIKMKLPQLIASMSANATVQGIMQEQIKMQQMKGKIINPNSPRRH